MAARSPAVGSSEASKSEHEKDPLYDEELDFCSPKFNPQRALLSPDTPVPYPQVKSFPSVSSYENAVRNRQQKKRHSESSAGESSHKGGHADRHRTSAKPGLVGRLPQSASAPDTNNSKNVLVPKGTNMVQNVKATSKVHDTSSPSLPGSRSETTRDPEFTSTISEQPSDHGKQPSDEIEGGSKQPAAHRTRRNVFTRMEAMSGPLHLLTRCVEERLQVRVWTRSAVIVRGICRGYIVAFDKYFNMAMIDVDEIYRRPAALGKVSSRRSHKLLAAKSTLHKEREQLKTKWKEKSNASADVLTERSSLGALSAAPGVNVAQLKDILSTVSLHQPGSNSTLTQPKAQEGDDSTKLDTATPVAASNREGGMQSHAQRAVHHSEALLNKLKVLKSVYPDCKAPLSPFEREALMLGIPDENVEIRHVGQLFIRGENVVLVNIVEDD